jgi:hypothetical protein
MKYSIGVLWVALAFAGSAAAAGKFDGKWVGQAVSCFPQGAVSSFAYLTVKDNKFGLMFTYNGQPATCNVTIGDDGVFQNKQCAVPTDGKITGNTLEINYRTDERICKATLKRE